MSKERKLINEEVQTLHEAVTESLKHVSKDMLGLKKIIDNLQKEIITLKTNHSVKTESLKREISGIKTIVGSMKESVVKIAKSVRNKPITVNESPMKRKDNIDDLVSEIDKINLRIEKVESKLKM